ncbi:type VI secretion system-associated protein TagF [Halioxenophilus aromaticivorans]|uniref:Type VI secretion system-associated protein TagF n=1 Tax=Halioxenophilus aromaticivorans TaxID=1306992 RepID=A0AAV3U3G4_9ALTE
MAQQDTCGIFGKLPMQSDFISHFLPTTYTEYWHAWLQSCLSISQEQLAEQWQEYYLNAPIWRFAAMPDVVHQQAVVGVVIPSVDEVGRYFPLTIAHIGDHVPWQAYLEGGRWYQEAEKTALLALEDELAYSRFIEFFEQLPVPAAQPWPAMATELSFMARTQNMAFDQTPTDDPVPHALQLLHYNAERMLGNYSLWWTEGSDAVLPCLLTCSGMPDSGQFSAMIDGQWQKWGWNHSQVVR